MDKFLEDIAAELDRKEYNPFANGGAGGGGGPATDVSVHNGCLVIPVNKIVSCNLEADHYITTSIGCATERYKTGPYRISIELLTNNPYLIGEAFNHG